MRMVALAVGLAVLFGVAGCSSSEAPSTPTALDPSGGSITPDSSSPGTGLTLRRQDVERYRVR